MIDNYLACGGCGAKTPQDRCIGCLHNFGGGSWLASDVFKGEPPALQSAVSPIKLPSGRALSSYAACSSTAIAGGSFAQMTYFIEDAKKDIAYLAARCEKLERSA